MRGFRGKSDSKSEDEAPVLKKIGKIACWMSDPSVDLGAEVTEDVLKKIPLKGLGQLVVRMLQEDGQLNYLRALVYLKGLSKQKSGLDELQLARRFQEQGDELESRGRYIEALEKYLLCYDFWSCLLANERATETVAILEKVL